MSTFDDFTGHHGDAVLLILNKEKDKTTKKDVKSLITKLKTVGRDLKMEEFEKETKMEALEVELMERLKESLFESAKDSYSKRYKDLLEDVDKKDMITAKTMEKLKVQMRLTYTNLNKMRIAEKNHELVLQWYLRAKLNIAQDTISDGKYVYECVPTLVEEKKGNSGAEERLLFNICRYIAKDTSEKSENLVTKCHLERSASKWLAYSEDEEIFSKILRLLKTRQTQTYIYEGR